MNYSVNNSFMFKKKQKNNPHPSQCSVSLLIKLVLFSENSFSCVLYHLEAGTSAEWPHCRSQRLLHLILFLVWSKGIQNWDHACWASSNVLIHVEDIRPSSLKPRPLSLQRTILQMWNKSLDIRLCHRATSATSLQCYVLGSSCKIAALFSWFGPFTQFS